MLASALRIAAVAIALALTPSISARASEPDAGTSLSDLQAQADAAETRGNLSRAMELWQQIGSQLGGAPVAERMYVATRGAQILLQAGEPAAARTWSDTAIGHIAKSVGTNTAEHAEAQLLRAEIERRAGDYAEALRRLELSVGSLPAGSGKPPVAVSIVRARTLIDLGRLAEAEREASAAFADAREHADQYPLDLAAAAAALGRARLEAGAYESARAVMQIAVDFERAVFHRGHPRVAEHLVALAEAQIALGRTAEADRNLRTALLGDRLAWPQDGLAVAEVATAMGSLFASAGDEQMAREDLGYALQLLGTDVAKTHRMRLLVALRLAELELAAGKLDAARPHLVVAEQALLGGPSDPLHARLLVLRARERRLAGDANAAAGFLGKVAGVAAALPSAALAEALDEQAAVLALLGNVDAAVQSMTAAVDAARGAFGKDHPRVADLLRTEASLHLRAGRVADATRLLGEAEAIHERALTERLAWGLERHKRTFVRALAGETDEIVALALGPAKGDANAVDLAMSAILRRKGRVLDALTGDLDVLRRRATEPDRQLLARAQTLRARVASHRLQGPGELEYARYLDGLDDAESRLRTIDATMSRRTAGFARAKYRVDTKNVAAALPDRGLLLEYYRFAAPDGEPHYAVFALAADGTLAGVDLGAAKPIDATVEALRAALMRSDGAYEASARQGFAQLLQPVWSQIAASSVVFVSPDSSLNLLPFAALVDAQGRFFLELQQSSYVSSGRDLLAMSEHNPPRSGPVVFADPEFGTPRAVGRTSTPLTGAEFPALPGTAREAQALASLLPSPHVFARADATEAKLRKVAGPSVLHVATHGFFLGAPEGGSEASRGIEYVRNEGPPAALAVEDPLLRSGLAFAGANVHEPRDDDGVVTASELLSLDLHGTQLVVLSACETGVGELDAGEGVYGLRRSLVVAGTATQVMSLWKVDDAATHDLMVEFYTRLMKGKLGRAEAMRHAQLEVRRDRPHPYYWAGFFVSGNPTAMPADARTGPPGIEAEGCRCRASSSGEGRVWPLLLFVMITARRRRP